MVTLNFTIVVQLGLFLIFLWSVNRLVFGPVLITLDQRNEKLADDEVSTETDSRKAGELEGSYLAEMSAARRGSLNATDAARREH